MSGKSDRTRMITRSINVGELYIFKLRNRKFFNDLHKYYLMDTDLYTTRFHQKSFQNI